MEQCAPNNIDSRIKNDSTLTFYYSILHEMVHIMPNMFELQLFDDIVKSCITNSAILDTDGHESSDIIKELHCDFVAMKFLLLNDEIQRIFRCDKNNLYSLCLKSIISLIFLKFISEIDSAFSADFNGFTFADRIELLGIMNSVFKAYGDIFDKY